MSQRLKNSKNYTMPHVQSHAVGKIRKIRFIQNIFIRQKKLNKTKGNMR